MEIEQAIYAHLTTAPALAALVGTRVYPDQGAEGATLPFVVYEQAEQEKQRVLAPHPTHATPGYVGLTRWSMHIEIIAVTKASAKAVRNAVIAALDGFHGTLGTGAGSLTVAGVFNDAEESGAEPPQHAEGLGEYRWGIDLSIWFSP